MKIKYKFNDDCTQKKVETLLLERGWKLNSTINANLDNKYLPGGTTLEIYNYMDDTALLYIFINEVAIGRNGRENKGLHVLYSEGMQKVRKYIEAETLKNTDK